MSRHLFEWFISSMLLCSVSMTVGCSNSGGSSEPKAEMTDSDISKATNFVAGSQQDADILVKAVEETVAVADAAGFQALLDDDQLANRIFAGLDVQEDFRGGFKEGMREGGGLSGMSNEIMSAVQSGGDYQFVRYVKKENEVRPLFRLVLPESGGLNYHELVVSVDSTMTPRIADIYVYLSGELLSQTIRRLILPAVAAENAGIVATLTGAESEFVRNFSTIQQINQANESQNFQEALRLIATLPPSLQNDKTILMMKLLVAQQVSDEEYANVIRDLEKNFPNDPARDIRSIDLHAMQGNFQEALNAVDRLIAATEDPYLNILKVNSLVELGRTDEARAALAAVKVAHSEQIDVYWVEISLLLRAKDHAATAKLLDEMGEKFGVEFNDLSTIPEYAEFAASDEGKAWMQKQAAAAAP